MKDNPLQRCVRCERLFLIADLQAGLCPTCHNGHLSQTAVDLAKQLRDLPGEADLFAWARRIQEIIQQTESEGESARRWARTWKRLVKKMGFVIRNFREGKIYKVQQERIAALEKELAKYEEVAQAEQTSVFDAWVGKAQRLEAEVELLRAVATEAQTLVDYGFPNKQYSEGWLPLVDALKELCNLVRKDTP